VSRFACGMWHDYSYHAGATGFDPHDPGLSLEEWRSRRLERNRRQWFEHVARIDAAMLRIRVTDEERQRALATKWRLQAERRKRQHDNRFVEATEAMLRGEL
jgi:hypothetical protein